MRPLCRAIVPLLIAASAQAQTTDTADGSPRQTESPATPLQGLHFRPDAGLVYQSGDFRMTAWGFAEWLLDPDGPDYFRRVRQGAEFALPRLTPRLRIAAVYEVDLTNTNAFGLNPGPTGHLGSRNFENLFVTLQDVDDPARFRLLAGYNTSILSREDNLSSGNLPTINRSLILEEHGSVNTFGAQSGVQLQSRLTPRVALLASVGDNRGSLNAQNRYFAFGRAMATKLVLTPFTDAGSGRVLGVGFGIDRTKGFPDRTFVLATAIALTPVAALPASGTKTTGELDLVYTFPMVGRSMTFEAEGLYSRFAGSSTTVYGGYAMAQMSLFDIPGAGDFDLFARFDVVRASTDDIAARVTQEAFRTGINYNLPNALKLVSLHLEYAHNTISGPAQFVQGVGSINEFRIGFRASLQQYIRH